MTDLPESWEQVEIVEVLAKTENGKPFQQGWSPQCEAYPADPDGWGVLKTTAIQHGEFRDHENKALPADLDPRPQIEVAAGDVLMTCAGPRNRCGVACLVEHTRPRLMMSGKMYRFRPHPEALHPKYLAYLIQRRETQLQIDLMKTGISDSGLNLTHDRFGQLGVPLAPLPEQHRIVAKIEALFSELDKAVESLTLARAQLKTYRQALLKHAFEGKLTADWRAANADKLETPEALLSRIRKEREARYTRAFDAWQTALVEWRAGGEVGRKPSRPSRPEVVGRPEIPDDLKEVCGKHWGWLRLADIAEVSGGLTKNPAREKLPLCMKYLRVGNVYADRLNLEHITEIGVTEDDWENVKLADGDILVVEGNGSVDQIGRVAIWGNEFENVGHQNHLIRVRLIEGMDPRYFLSFLMSPLGRELIVRQASSTSGLHTLSISKVSALPVPVAANVEQKLLLEAIAAPISQIEKLAEEIDTALAKANALRQSILKQAFSGQLVAQDPADEPASALLARLRGTAPILKTRRKKTA